MDTTVPRSLAGSGRLGAGFLVLALATMFTAHAQQAPVSPPSAPLGDIPKADPSPVNPGDLTRPVFDTVTHVEKPVSGINRNATTVVAEVEGRPITLGDVGDMIRTLPPAFAELPFETLFPKVLEQLVRQEALVVRAQQSGLDQEPDVRRQLKGTSDHALGDMYLQREAAKGITEARLLERYNKDFAGRPGPEEAHVHVIVCDTENSASGVLAELKGGAAFATVARRAGSDATAQDGGDAGFLTRDSMTPEVGAVAFSLAIGQLPAYPVLSGGRWVVVRVDERRVGPAPSFFAMRAQLVKALEHEDAADLAGKAMAGMVIRQYDLVGKEK
jgi:peptidyl-prolyl cis-trans isomerase C